MIRLSQSMLKDWESMCHVAFKVKHLEHYDTEEENPFYIGDKEVVIMGNVYEQNIIGVSRGGKVTTPPENLAKKEMFRRMMSQAKRTRNWLRSLDGRPVAVQNKIEASFKWEDVTVPIQGHLDIDFKYNDGRIKVIDLKLSGKLTATFGPFQWSNLDKIDYTQARQYILLKNLQTGVPVGDIPFDYHIADTSPEEKMKIISATATDSSIEEHKYRLYYAYTEIQESILVDYFQPKNDYNRCSSCPLKDTCSHINTNPPIEEVII